MAKYIPGTEPKTRAEKYWYARGFSQGLESRTREIQASQARADAKWADIKIMRTRLYGMRAMALALEHLTDSAGID